MSLIDYKKKRSFDKTTEPEGGKGTGKELRFVIQKHAASHLHYDFRLEMGGVLKSWAVPKGPSTDPTVKRLAMMVEDHPYDYRNFEGIIPQGEYGGGTVIVWDEGTYTTIDKFDSVAAQEKYLLKELKNGSVKMVLHGKKLKGEFALVKTHGMAENSWLLLKHKDKYANEADITKKDKSVVSKKTIEQVEKTSTNIYGENNAKKKSKDPILEVAKQVKSAKPANTKKPSLSTKQKTPFYDKVEPMLATLVDNPIDDDHW
jgi:bifunctional non-homologous end joining protein LigD